MKFNNNDHHELNDEAKIKLGMVKAKGEIWVAKSAIGVYHIDKYNFFKDNDPIGFAHKKSFIDYLYTLKKGHLKVLECTLEMMNSEIPFSVSSAQRPEPDGKFSVIIEHKTDNIPYSNRLYLIEDMHRLFWQYEFSILTCNTSLEELYNEARQAN